MKISLSWVFDHINAPRVGINVEQLVERFNKTTAEIEGLQKISFDLQSLSVAQVLTVTDEHVTLTSPEWQQELTLANRPDAQEGDWFLVSNANNKMRWAATADFGSAKESLLPQIWVDESFARGQWKDKLEREDYILEVDNKSITHRPDMWGHRGFAREIAAIYDLPLIPIANLCQPTKIHKSTRATRTSKAMPFGITIETAACSRFNSVYLHDIHAYPTLLWAAHRLCRVDGKPINALVDGTNYAMFDVGHPMHAFDANKIDDSRIVIRYAHTGETLTLLDDTTATLTNEDVVIANSSTPLSLAGIMGGKETGITPKTTAVLLEAACFDATTIRRSSIQHKERTDASARFEKSLDTNQVAVVLERYLKLMADSHIIADDSYTMVSVGKPTQTVVIELEHTFLQKRLGIPITSEEVLNTLSKLGFDVTIEQLKNKGGTAYHIEVPSYRATKDVTIPEDLVEEIGRFIGYDKIPTELPCLRLRPSDTNAITATHDIKYLLAHGLGMQELYTYPLYDESFLRTIAYTPTESVILENPVSENWVQMVTSLVPNLLKAIDENCHQNDLLRFFEWARTWHLTKTTIVERRKVAGVMFDKKNSVDFYASKQLLHTVFDARGLHVTWHKMETPMHPWCTPYTSAKLTMNGQELGYAGLVDPPFLRQITEGSAFVFELDGSIMASYESDAKKFTPLPKYPEVSRDISLLVPLAVTTQQLQTMIANVDQRITQALLVDFFEKKEWEGKKAMTFSLTIYDKTKTMLSAEVDAIVAKVVASLKSLGAEQR